MTLVMGLTVPPEERTYRVSWPSGYGDPPPEPAVHKLTDFDSEDWDWSESELEEIQNLWVGEQFNYGPLWFNGEHVIVERLS